MYYHHLNDKRARFLETPRKIVKRSFSRGFCEAKGVVLKTSSANYNHNLNN